MRRKIKVLLSVILYVLLGPIIFCLILFIGDWIRAELIYNIWLKQDSLRMDFTPYETCLDVRAALLVKFPVGTSEADLKAFFLANRTQIPYKNDDWQPNNISYRICGFTTAMTNGHGVALQVYSTDRGHIFNRLLRGTWVIFFELDPKTHTLKNIQVDGYGFSIGL